MKVKLLFDTVTFHINYNYIFLKLIFLLRGITEKLKDIILKFCTNERILI